MIRAFRGVRPRIAASAFVDPSAQVIGDVQIGERSSIWPNAVLRGDVNSIRIGDDSNIQDNCVVHVDIGDCATAIGNRVTVGHAAVLHGCSVEDDCLIGMSATVLNRARIGRGSVVGAGSVIPEGAEIPPGSLVLGVPGQVRRLVSEEERARFTANCASYVDYGRAYKEETP
ncbi:MAG: gamma carbonic anhydrase family protein [Bryobacterales bacterium]|jgi:carbonic anhydrase/acetyltransferase-like protein (isoleucine patch superfamily)|nr:gamma carbonic anhydrase family protein [Bryobacterales bacterium]